jgi:hypothetical protein
VNNNKVNLKSKKAVAIAGKETHFNEYGGGVGSLLKTLHRAHECAEVWNRQIKAHYFH